MAVPAHVRKALRIAVKLAIRGAVDIVRAPRAIGARVDAGEGQRPYGGHDDNDSPHGNLLVRD
jgi:hypothetical protein